MQRGRLTPAAALGVIMLGPGTTVSHRAMELLGDAGASVIWVGENGIRCYAHGNPLTTSSRLLTAQAKAVSNTHTRLSVARKMYQMRFPNEDVAGMTMQQLRGKEGSRVRSIYRRFSKETGVQWDGRNYDPNDYSNSDPVNMSLSAANFCLYGITHCVISALGCSPGLGFVHTGHDKSFVYDIADLYKAELTIPIAFELARKKPDDISSMTRKAVRDAVSKCHLMEKMVVDIRSLLLDENTPDDDETAEDTLGLWDEKTDVVRSSTSYGRVEERDTGYDDQ